VAKKLGIRQIICPPGAGVASAVGLLTAPVAVDLAASLPMRMSRWDFTAVQVLLERLTGQGESVVRAAGVAAQDISYTYSVDMRHVGQGHEISVPAPGRGLPEERFRNELLDSFYATYAQLYGRTVAGSDVEAITWRLRIAGPRGQVGRHVMQARASVEAPGTRPARRSVYFEELGGVVATPVYSHDALEPGVELGGPVIVEQRESTIVVAPSARATVDRQRNLVMTLS
jgi:N-methylhydantoinase A